MSITGLGAGSSGLTVVQDGNSTLQVVGEAFQSFSFSAYDGALYLGTPSALGTIEVYI